MTVRPWHEDLDDEDYEVMRLEAEEDRIVTGPQEKPTTLNRIEAARDVGGRVLITTEEREALVAVARAARPALTELDDAIKAAVNGEWSQEDYDRWDAAREAGEAALARLDTSAEGGAR